MDFFSFYDQHGVTGLKRSGKWLTGWCPFHADEGSKQKGFVINATNGLWKCHSGCEGGTWHNATTFCKLKSISIEEAPDYDRNYRSYGYPKGGVLKKPHKKGKSDIWAKTGDEANAKYPYNMEAIELAREEQKTLWICEGGKDTETILEAGELATGIPNASGYSVFQGISLDDIPEVIIAMDHDGAGNNARGHLKDMFPFAKVIVWPKQLTEHFDVTDVKQEAERIEGNFIEELRTYVKDDTWQDEGSLVDWFLREIDTGAPYIKTGFEAFDKELDGLMPGGLHVIQGNSSIGKTTFCKQLADQVHEQNPDLPVFFFALEDSLRTMRAMTLSRLTHDNGTSIENQLIRKGGEALNDNDQEILKNISRRAKEIYGKDYYLIAGEPGLDVLTIRDKVTTKLRRIGKKNALVIVDYLQILPSPRGERLYSLMDRIDFNLHELQCLARDLNGPVILTSSTTKEDVKETDKKKEPGTVKGKGSVNILYTPRMLFELIETEQKESYKEINLWIIKNSEGPKGFSIPFQYFFKYSNFRKALTL